MNYSGIACKLYVSQIPGRLGRGFTWTRHDLGYLIDPLPGVRMRSDILVDKLVNCRSFRIQREYEGDDLYDSDYLGYSDAIAIIFLVIGETGLPIRSLQLDSTSSDGTNRMYMRRLDSRYIQKPQFWTGWAHLEELVLQMPLAYEAVDYTADLVLRAPNLLRLKIGHAIEVYDEAFFRRLYTASTAHKLQELDLGDQSYIEDSITKLIFRFGHSLRALSLWRIVITNGGTWASVFRRLRTNLPLLERISVARPMESTSRTVWVMFRSLSDDRVHS
ncbi:hypothetical protein MMC17_010263 [Xylographa soralifera]|nr:hypothetical protein [Xylographa soralifera]